MPTTPGQPQRGREPDIQRCIDGDCIGAFCPCLCHTSLKVEHDEIRLEPIPHGR
jgi:hypothetical protein